MFSTKNHSIEELPAPVKPLTEVEASAVKGGLTPASLTYLGGAFTVGWGIGTYLDKQFGISNKIGDWLAS